LPAGTGSRTTVRAYDGVDDAGMGSNEVGSRGSLPADRQAWDRVVTTRVALVGEHVPAFAEAVRAGGGTIVPSSDAEGLVFTGDVDELRAALHPGIRWVQTWGAGVEWLRDGGFFDHDRQWLAARGVYAGPIAEYCLAMLLAGARDLPVRVRRQTWRYEYERDRSLAGSTIGVVGAGGIGARVIELVTAVGAYAVALNRTGRPVPGARQSYGPDGLDELLAESDGVVLALPDTPSTKRLIGARELARMRSHAWIVNVGRGTAIDTDALVAALEGGQIGGAALDVTDPEPLPDGHPLWSQPNAVVTPHIACTPDLAVPLMAARIRENVARAARREELLGRVDVIAGY
jgi:phosphoglycerate dehydrogenase-like enzyme